METQINTDNLHEILVRSVVDYIDNMEDALNWMTLLHTHQITLREPLALDAPGVTTFPAITQRHAAAVVGNLWGDHQDKGKTGPDYLYFLWNERHAYETIDDVPQDIRAQILQRGQLLSTERRILSVKPEL